MLTAPDAAGLPEPLAAGLGEAAAEVAGLADAAGAAEAGLAADVAGLAETAGGLEGGAEDGTAAEPPQPARAKRDSRTGVKRFIVLHY